MLLFLEFLTCALLFGSVLSIVLLAIATPRINRLPLRQLKAVGRRMGKDHVMRITEEHRRTPEGAPESPEFLTFVAELQGAADAAFPVMKRMVALLIAVGCALGVAASWFVFYG